MKIGLTTSSSTCSLNLSYIQIIMATILSIPSMQDLKVKLHQSVLIKPLSQETDNKSFFLSSVDQVMNFNITMVNFFAANSDYPPEIVAKNLKFGLEKLLVSPYDFMAGRFKLNEETGRLEIACNGAGAGFLVGSSDYSLEDLGDLVRPNLGFRQLAPQTLDGLGPDEEQPLCIFQVTSFKCGGFAIGMMMNHVLFDGVGGKIFLLNLASQAFDHHTPLAVPPCNDRHLLATRSPPQISFQHPKFFIPDIKRSSGPPVSHHKHEELDYKVFKFTPTTITRLKDKANPNSDPAKRISNLTAATTLIWRCKALSYTNSYVDRVSTLMNVIDIRSRVEPALPASYAGNAVVMSFAGAKCGEMEECEFSELVDKVAAGPGRVSDDYVRLFIDWYEVNKGIPGGEYMVTSWMGLGFEKVEYPWGEPVFCGPVVSHMKRICCVFPDQDGFINALISLPAVEMEKFESLFRSFFEEKKVKKVLNFSKL